MKPLVHYYKNKFFCVFCDLKSLVTLTEILPAAPATSSSSPVTGVNERLILQFNV